MCQGPAPIFKINLLLADISFGIAAESFHILKCGHGSLSHSRHHLTMSCKNDISVAHESDSSDRGLSLCTSELLNDTRNVFRLIFQNVADPVQKFPCNLDDGLCLTHPFAVLLEGHQKRRIFTDRNPGGFDEQPPQLRMAPVGNPSECILCLHCLECLESVRHKEDNWSREGNR